MVLLMVSGGGLKTAEAGNDIPERHLRLRFEVAAAVCSEPELLMAGGRLRMDWKLLKYILTSLCVV